MRVYLFRGLAGNLFSTGMDELAGKLRDAGMQPSVHSWIERKGIEAEAISRFRSGELTGPIALVGHSLGGNSASFMGNNLVDNGVGVTYIATIDPTEPLPNPPGVSADNFHSSDFRAEKVEGATNISRPDLNHIQIDKDEKVHNRILEMCLSGHMESDRQALPPAQLPAPNPGGGNRPGVDSLQIARERLANDNTTGTTVSGNGEAADPAVELPVNYALGRRIGDLLNGRKTATGLLGLVGTLVLPIVFPQLAPVKAVFEIVRIGGVAAATEPGQSLFLPIFFALTGWGVLGKLEKWVKGT